MSHAHHEPTRDETLAAGHELTDAHAGPVLRFLAFLIVTTVFVAGLMVVFYNYLERREASEKVARYPMGEGQNRPLPPPPRLQPYPFTDLRDLRREEDRLLTTYEWVDRNAGTVRIPVARAIELMAERGLPYRHATPEAAPAAPPAAAKTATK